MMTMAMGSDQIQALANRARMDLVRRTENMKETIHWGSAFSLMEIVSVLFSGVLNDDDKFFLSKGHGAPGVYAIMHQMGTLSDEDWESYRQDGSPISELMEYNPEYGFNISGGSLGLSPAYACGMGLLWKKQNRKDHIYVLVGDGEMDEGSVWEAIISIAHYHLENITLIVDANKLQLDGNTADIMNIQNLRKSFEDFGWTAYETDGHDCESLLEIFSKGSVNGKPTAVICDTIKGKGISFMEGDSTWHDRAMTKNEYQRAWEEVCEYASN